VIHTFCDFRLCFLDDNGMLFTSKKKRLQDRHTLMCAPFVVSVVPTLLVVSLQFLFLFALSTIFSISLSTMFRFSSARCPSFSRCILFVSFFYFSLTLRCLIHRLFIAFLLFVYRIFRFQTLPSGAVNSAFGLCICSM